MTAEQFSLLLRQLMNRSSRKAGQIARYSDGKLPRSTAYKFVQLSNPTLPKNWGQVAAFARACKCSDGEIELLHGIWTALSEHPSHLAVSNTPKKTSTEQKKKPADIAKFREEMAELEAALLAGAADNESPLPLRHGVLHETARALPDTVKAGVRRLREWNDEDARRARRSDRSMRRSQRAARRWERNGARYTAGRLRVLAATRLNFALLVGTTLLLQVLHRFIGQLVPLVATVLVAVNAVVVLRNPAVVRIRSIRSPVKLGVGITLGLGASWLSLAMNSMVYTAMFTGLLVLVGTLIWQDAVQWHEMLNWRGLGLLVLSLWFGISAGNAATAQAFPPAGAVLFGCLLWSWAMLELHLKVDDHQWL
ncbi:hypothetical protein [Nocardia vulneris]|uniref:hypothetical protein n=1 Tax=Nocardia vulneris TaxID=1141657 RepID=UPI000AFECE51|nr:hypothetical protein [Nocardia vulneris]